MPHLHAPRGFALVLAAVALLLAAGWVLAASFTGFATTPARHRASEMSLAQAREALLAFATDRPIDPIVGPGYLPCPDADGDGWAEATCGSLSGDSGQEQRLGRLPWKTLGLPDLRDGFGERLWYAVSSKHKGLLNCAASRACVDMSPTQALGTITVRDAFGALLHDGAIDDAARAAQGGAAAVILAPGAPLERRSGAVRLQRQDCGAAECAPAHYLDAVTFEDNAAFRDRSDPAGRAANRDGFVAGPVADADGVALNDRLAMVGYSDLMPRVMGRVALEAALCLRLHASLPGSLGRYPAPLPACGGGEARPAFGRLPAFGALQGCNLALPADTHSWWKTWNAHVLYAPAAEGDANGIDAVDIEGRVVARGKRFALVISPRPGACATPRLRCDEVSCTQVVVGDAADVARAFP